MGRQVVNGRLADDDPLHSRLLFTCVLGNRGLVRLRRGEIAEAETLIQRSMSVTATLMDAPEAREEDRRAAREWQAERHLWLAEAAAKRSDPQAELGHLTEAARLEGEFADKARQRLAAR